MIEMTRRFLRQKFGSPAMVIALSLLAILTAVQGTITEPEHALGAGFLAILLIAAGSVSRDVSGGTIQMILARPITRTSYLFGRYLGILAVYAAFLAVSAALTVVATRLLPHLLGAGVPGVSAESIVRGVAIAMANALLFSAILLFFSTFLRGYSDVLAYFALMILLGAMPGLGAALRKPWLSRAGEILRANLLPQVDWSGVLRGRELLQEPTGRWVLAVAAFLAFAAIIFSRREFSYGQD
jgi:ABC-type transport system involved in multi-copper enzyme maturation permease subunit